MSYSNRSKAPKIVIMNDVFFNYFRTDLASFFHVNFWYPFIYRYNFSDLHIKRVLQF